MILKPSDAGFLGVLTAPEKLVFLALVVHADAKGECWPSFGALAKGTGLSRSTVIRALERLETCGLIERYRRGLSEPNLYRITLPGAG